MINLLWAMLALAILILLIAIATIYTKHKHTETPELDRALFRKWRRQP